MIINDDHRAAAVSFSARKRAQINFLRAQKINLCAASLVEQKFLIFARSALRGQFQRSTEHCCSPIAEPCRIS